MITGGTLRTGATRERVKTPARGALAIQLHTPVLGGGARCERDSAARADHAEALGPTGVGASWGGGNATHGRGVLGRPEGASCAGACLRLTPIARGRYVERRTELGVAEDCRRR